MCTDWRMVKVENNKETNSIKNIYYLIKWILLLAALGLIIFLDLMDARSTIQLSDKTSDVVVTVVQHPDWIHSHIRKLGHTGEYFFLGFSSYLCLGKKGLILDMGISFLDQCFKSILPTRHFDWTDFPYDIVGYVLGSVMGWCCFKIISLKHC